MQKSAILILRSRICLEDYNSIFLNLVEQIDQLDRIALTHRLCEKLIKDNLELPKEAKMYQ